MTENIQVKPSRAEETVTIDGELLLEEELETPEGGKTSYKFYDIGEETVLSVCRFFSESGEEISSYGPHSPKNLEDIERSLINAGAVDGKLPEPVRGKLEASGIT